MAKVKKKEVLGPRIDDLEQRVIRGTALLADIRALFPEASAMARIDRRRSQGRMGTDESTALRSVVDAIDLSPAVFESLADEDEGNDPKRVETDLIRQRFTQHALYSQLSRDISALATVFSDTALAVGAQIKPLALAAYEIAKPVSRRDAKLREKIAPALDYYRGSTGGGRGETEPVEPEPETNE